MVGNRRQGWALYGAMAVMLVATVAVDVRRARQPARPAQQAAAVARRAATSRARSSASGSPAARCGPPSRPRPRTARSTPPTRPTPGRRRRRRFLNMMTGEVIFGGVGSGLYGMLLFVMLAVFIAGLMVGRTPEYLGKKIEAREVKLVADRHPVRAAGRAGRSRRLRSRPSTAPRRSTTRARRASPRRSTPTARRATTTARRWPATPASCSRTRRATSARSGSRSPICSAACRCCSRASCRCSRSWRWPARSPSSASRRSVPARSAPTRRRSSGCWSSSSLVVAALTFFPALMLGPIVQGLTDALF